MMLGEAFNLRGQCNYQRLEPITLGVFNILENAKRNLQELINNIMLFMQVSFSFKNIHF